MEREYTDEMAETVRKQVHEIYQQFQISPHFTSMFKYCQKEAKAVIFQFMNSAYMYDLYIPAEWSISTFIGQSYNVQRKCMYPKTFFKAIPKVIYHFAKFCAENSLGQFTVKEAEEYKEDLKDGMYEGTFYSDWNEGSRDRLESYQTLVGN